METWKRRPSALPTPAHGPATMPCPTLLGDQPTGPSLNAQGPRLGVTGNDGERVSPMVPSDGAARRRSTYGR